MDSQITSLDWSKLLYMNAINRFLLDVPAVDVHIVTQEAD